MCVCFLLQLIAMQSLMCVMLCHATLAYNALCRYTKHAEVLKGRRENALLHSESGQRDRA